MPATTVFVFEGGPAGGPLCRDLQAIREAVALHLIGLWLQAGLPVVLATDRPGLAAAAARAGATVAPTSSPFHFGTCLGELLRRHPCQRAVVMGGAALPLLRASDVRRLAARLQAGDGVFWANNLYSPDLVAVAPAAALLRIRPVDADNQLGLALLDLGLRGVALPDRARFKLDLDTPVDAAILATDAECPEPVGRALAGLAWLPGLAERVRQVERTLATPGAQLAVLGRVGPHVLAFIDARLRCRTRVIAEERGLRASARAAGGVVSLVGGFIDGCGPEAFFDLLGRAADAVLLDTRPLLAHWRLAAGEEERFCADAGLLDRLPPGPLARLVAAARAVPALLGGHSLVYGGLWRLAERAAAGVVR
jgi:hypothetical protein